MVKVEKIKIVRLDNILVVLNWMMKKEEKKTKELLRSNNLYDNHWNHNNNFVVEGFLNESHLNDDCDCDDDFVD